MQHDARHVAVQSWCAVAKPPIAVASLVTGARIRMVMV